MHRGVVPKRVVRVCNCFRQLGFVFVLLLQIFPLGLVCFSFVRSSVSVRIIFILSQRQNAVEIVSVRPGQRGRRRDTRARLSVGGTQILLPHLNYCLCFSFCFLFSHSIFRAQTLTLSLALFAQTQLDSTLLSELSVKNCVINAKAWCARHFGTIHILLLFLSIIYSTCFAFAFALALTLISLSKLQRV